MGSIPILSRHIDLAPVAVSQRGLSSRQGPTLDAEHVSRTEDARLSEELDTCLRSGGGTAPTVQITLRTNVLRDLANVSVND